MGKALEAGQLAGFLVVDLDTNDIKIGTATTINASSGDIISGGDITNSGDITSSGSVSAASSVSAATYYGLGDGITFSEIDPGVIQNNFIVEKLTADTFDSNVGIVTLSYSTTSMVAICKDASSDIILSVDSIPTTSDFDNRSLSFSVIVINTGVARTCTTVYFNNQNMPIKWFGGSIDKAISGGVTKGTSGYDIYNFIGINTVGSASTISNYEVLGIVNGNFY